MCVASSQAIPNFSVFYNDCNQKGLVLDIISIERPTCVHTFDGLALSRLLLMLLRQTFFSLFCQFSERTLYTLVQCHVESVIFRPLRRLLFCVLTPDPYEYYVYIFYFVCIDHTGTLLSTL